MSMLATADFVDAGVRTGSHQLVMVDRDPEQTKKGDIGLSLDKAKHLLSCVQQEFVAAQAEQIVERSRVRARCGRRLPLKDVEMKTRPYSFGRIPLAARQGFYPAPAIQRWK